MIKFEYPEDQLYFEKLLLHNGFSNIMDFANMFDFRLPEIKRKEFNRIRNNRLEELKSIHGLRCMLNLHCCDLSSGVAVDHLIPISTNKLNKVLRNLKAEKGKKVKTQSFGSNHIDNLVIACNNCNNYKKHRILESNEMIPILIAKKNK
tara:strand:+ start:103 stop:549 length:447 start_codon:yes stop_codon:yes gene_type:complete